MAITVNNGLDLSERLSAYMNWYDDMEELIRSLSKRAGFEQCERIYIGSSFCSRSFLFMEHKQLEKIMAVCEKEKMKVSLVVPIFTEKNLVTGKVLIEKLLATFKGAIDEIVVNDYGMLRYIASTYKGSIDLAMGRMFMKDYREPRYPEYFNTPYRPKAFTPYFKEIIRQYDVKAILCDATHRHLDLSQKPEGVEIGVYEPYTYMTVGQICEIGSSHLPIDKKFRPNGPCLEECVHEKRQYFIEDGRRWLKLGRTIYFENRDFSISGLETIRRIYCPFDEEVERNESTCSTK